MNWELPTIKSDAPLKFTELYDFLAPPECQDEKRTMRQFMALLELGEVPSFITVEDITEWLSGEKCFIKKCQDCSQLGDFDQLAVVRAWYMKRRDQLVKIQQEMLKELERERHLSELFGRKVTMEGLRRCMKMFRPSVETEVRHLLCPVFSGLPHSVMPSPSHFISEGPEAPGFLQKAEELSPKLVTTTFRHLLGGGAQGGGATWTSIEGERATAAMEEIRWLLKDTLISALAPYGDVPVHKVVFTTAALARDVVRAVFEKFEVESSTFCLLNDSSCLDSMEATRQVITEVTMEKKAKNKPGVESTAKLKNIITLASDPGTKKSCSINSVEQACKVKVIIRGQKDITVLAGATVDTKPSGKPLTGSQTSIGSLVESCPDLTLKEVEATSAVDKLERGEATKLAIEAGFNTKRLMDSASSEMKLMLVEDEPLLSVNGVYHQEALRLPVTSELTADRFGGVTEECCSVGGEEKQDGGQKKKGVIAGFLCRMKKLFTCISKEED